MYKYRSYMCCEELLNPTHKGDLDPVHPVSHRKRFLYALNTLWWCQPFFVRVKNH